MNYEIEATEENIVNISKISFILQINNIYSMSLI